MVAGGARVIELLHVSLQAVVVLGGIGALGAVVLNGLRVGLEVGAQHGEVDAGVLALRALVRLGAHVVAHVVLQVVLVLGDEGTLGALQQLLGLYVQLPLVRPVLLLVGADEGALLALVHLGLSGRLAGHELRAVQILVGSVALRVGGTRAGRAEMGNCYLRKQINYQLHYQLLLCQVVGIIN